MFALREVLQDTVVYGEHKINLHGLKEVYSLSLLFIIFHCFTVFDTIQQKLPPTQRHSDHNVGLKYCFDVWSACRRTQGRLFTRATLC